MAVNSRKQGNLAAKPPRREEFRPGQEPGEQGAATRGDPYRGETEREDALRFRQFSGDGYFFLTLARFCFTRNFTILATSA